MSEHKVKGFGCISKELSPCKDCAERFTACHDKCPKDERGEFGYKSWKLRLDERNKARKAHANKPFPKRNGCW